MTKIYIIRNKENGKVYVGQTIKSLKHRFDQHYNAKTNCYIDNAMKKYGKDCFSIELICLCPDEDANALEQYYIEKYKAHYSQGGYNISIGGDVNPMLDPLARKRWEERIHSPEYIEKQRISATGRRHSEEARARMSVVQKELYKNRPDLKQKIAIHQPNRKEVNMVDDNDNVVKHFNTLSEACRYFGKDDRNSSTISKFINKRNKNGKRAKFWGYSWVSVE